MIDTNIVDINSLQVCVPISWSSYQRCTNIVYSNIDIIVIAYDNILVPYVYYIDIIL